MIITVGINEVRRCHVSIDSGQPKEDGVTNSHQSSVLQSYSAEIYIKPMRPVSAIFRYINENPSQICGTKDFQGRLGGKAQ